MIDGAKQFITNAGTDISGVVVHHRGDRHAGEELDRGDRTPEREISNLIVPNGTAGYEPGEPYRKMGWNASDTRPLTFADCRVPEDNLLGPRGAGFRQFLHVLDIGRIGVAAMGVGLAQGALDQALAYAKERTRVRSADLEVPGDPEQAREHVDRDRGHPAARLQVRLSEGPGRQLHADRRPGQAQERAPRGRGSPTRPSRSTAATATSRSTRCAGSTATRRS